MEIRRASATHRSLTSGSSGKNSPVFLNRRAILFPGNLLGLGGWERLTVRSSLSLTGLAGVSFALWDYHDDPTPGSPRISDISAGIPERKHSRQDPHSSSLNHKTILAEETDCRGRQRCSMARMRAASPSSSSSSSTFTHA